MLIFVTYFFFLVMKVVNMEAEILKALKFELGGPTVKTFLRCVSLLNLCPCCVNFACFSCFCLGILAHHSVCFCLLVCRRFLRRFLRVGQVIRRSFINTHFSVTLDSLLDTKIVNNISH